MTMTLSLPSLWWQNIGEKIQAPYRFCAGGIDPKQLVDAAAASAQSGAPGRNGISVSAQEKRYELHVLKAVAKQACTTAFGQSR